MTLKELKAIVASLPATADDYVVKVQATGGPWQEDVVDVTIDDTYRKVVVLNYKE